MKTLTIPISTPDEATKSLSLVNPADWGFAFTNTSTDLISVAEAYRDVGWFRTACDVRANAVVTTPWEIYRLGRDDEPVWVSGEEPPKELRELAGFEDVLYLTELSLITSAYAFWLKVDRGAGFEGLQFFVADSMEPAESTQGTQAWIRSVDGKALKDVIQPEQLVFLSVPNPFQEQAVKKGERMSEARAALPHATVLKSLNDFAVNDLENGMIRPMVATVPRGTSEPEQERILDKLKAKFTGKKSERVAVVEAGAIAFDYPGASLNDLAADDLYRIHQNGVATSLKVKHSMMQSAEAANRSVSEQDVRTFYTGVVMPRERVIQQAFNRQLFHDLGFRFEFHAERLEAFQTAELEKATQVATLWESGLTTRDEARLPIDGLDPVEDGTGGDYFSPVSPITLSTNGVG